MCVEESKNWLKIPLHITRNQTLPKSTFIHVYRVYDSWPNQAKHFGKVCSTVCIGIAEYPSNDIHRHSTRRNSPHIQGCSCFVSYYTLWILGNFYCRTNALGVFFRHQSSCMLLVGATVPVSSLLVCAGRRIIDTWRRGRRGLPTKFVCTVFLRIDAALEL